MEKSVRLQRYSRKDYSELVEFPVEIVGRDGVVRRYTFEDSIRLYRRRITFAPIRYRDVELIQAEVDHCRSRIDQLRKSYFYRYGWGTPEGQPAPADVFGPLAGEVAAFVCRVLRCEGRPEVRFEPLQAAAAGTSASAAGAWHGETSAGAAGASVDGPGPSTWYLVPKGFENGMLLYVYRFDGNGAEALRDRFFASLKELERNAREGDGEAEAERLVAFHHTVDCGFVLTGRGPEFDALVATQQEEDEPAWSEPTPWDQALEVIRRGDYPEGLARCRQLVSEQPWHRNAYVAGAVLAAHLEQPDVAEDFALLGSKYFPKDAALHYYLGLSRARQDRPSEAREALEVAIEIAPAMSAARLLLVVLLLQAGRFARARAIVAARDPVQADDRRADSALERLEQWLFWRRIMVWTGYGSAGLGLVATGLDWFGLVPVALGLVMAGVGMYAFRRELARMASWSRFEDVGQGLRRVRRHSQPSSPPVS